MKTIVMCSGGLDSVTLAHKVAAERTLTRLVSFDYSQRHNKELKYARRCATRLMAPHDVVDIAAVGRLLTGSADAPTSVPRITPPRALSARWTERAYDRPRGIVASSAFWH